MGWGKGLDVGDYLLLVSHHDSPDGRTRYRIQSISYYADPKDMWRAELIFDPR